MPAHLLPALSSCSPFFTGLIIARNTDKTLEQQLKLAYLNIQTQAELEKCRQKSQADMEISRQYFQERMEHLRFGQQMTLEKARQVFQKKLSLMNHELQKEITGFVKSVDMAIAQENLDFQKWRFEQEIMLQQQLANFNRETQFALADLQRKTALGIPEANKLFENWPLKIVPSQILDAHHRAGAVPLHVIISPPSVDFDRFGGGLPQNFPKIEERLAEALRQLLNKHYPLNSPVRPSELLDGAWDSNRFHGGASMKILFRMLKSEPVLILDSKADGDYLNFRAAYWGLGQDNYNYEQIISRLPYRDILYESAKERALKWKTDVRDKLRAKGKEIKDINEKYGGDNAVNLAMLEEDEEFRKDGIVIERHYKMNHADWNVLCEILSAYHCVITGVITDAHHLIHHGISPIFPELMTDLIKNKPILPVSDIMKWVSLTYHEVLKALETEQPHIVPEYALQIAKSLAKLPDKSFAEEMVNYSLDAKLKFRI
ncbi:MAG: hypothetical protein GY749_46935 [Desulfobacteraceae bacterium]|nr:hypothetical protein [Desulfobacteraceae bacterium]